MNIKEDKNYSYQDLSGTNLSEIELTGAYFYKANLSSAKLIKAGLNYTDLSCSNLTGANLSGAKLNLADLTRASLTKANLSETDLTGASLYKTDLSSANLTKANLSGADLSCANLTGADLIGANLYLTNLNGIDLTTVNSIDYFEFSSQDKEMSLANSILDVLSLPQNNLEMELWHTCDTSHCIAGWLELLHEIPLHLTVFYTPTLSKYFFADNKTAFEALERVAEGQESVWFHWGE